MAPPEMSCYTTPGNDLLADCVLLQIVAPFGEGLFAVLTAGGVFLTLWLAGSRDMATPSVVLIIFAGFSMTLLPGQFVTYAQTLMVLGLAGGIFAMLRRFVLTPGT